MIEGLQVAVYGKGGIGKSTVSSNITYKISISGRKVLQIGCDPKHDSTRDLLGGRVQNTVLNTMKEKKGELSIEDILYTSPCGADCIESGGPEPGIGCAGRGIITAMNQMTRLGLDRSNYDLVLYDVLGDVVCGGFAVPLRKDYAELVYLVTSGEFMAVYAANNILKGALNHSPEIPRIGGIILNRRGVKNEDELVERFAEAVGLPIVCRIPRDPTFLEAERLGKTVSEAFPDSEPSKQFDVLVENVIAQMNGTGERYLARPLGDLELDDLLKGKPIGGDRPVFRLPPKVIQKADGEACAARGASSAAQNVKDMTIIIHGPRACGYVMNNISDVHFLGNVKNNPILDTEYRNNFYCTDMDDKDSIFGGIVKLEKLIEDLYAAGKRTIMIITACIPGIIGDDVDGCIKRMEGKHGDLKLLYVKADGNIAGSVFAGITQVRSQLASLIDESVPPEHGLANLVSTVGMNGGKDKKRTIDLLNAAGYRLNTVLFNGCTVQEIKDCHRAEVCFPTSKRESSSDIARYLTEKGMNVSDLVIPSGYINTLAWFAAVRNSENAESVDSFVNDFRTRYAAELERAGSRIRGMRFYVISSFGRQVDWIIDVLKDAGVEILKVAMVGIIDASPLQEERNSGVPVLLKAGPKDIVRDMTELEPDFVLGDDRFIKGMGIRNAPIPKDNVGFEGSIELLRYLGNAVRVPVEEPRRDVL